MVPHPRQALVEIQLPLQLGDAAIDGRAGSLAAGVPTLYSATPA